jgi:hypothetical protein
MRLKEILYVNSITDLEEFAQKKGKHLTQYPISIEIINEIQTGTDEYGNELNGSIVAGRLRHIDTIDISKTPNILLKTQYIIQIPKYIFDIYKWKREMLQKIICHELAHINYPVSHSPEFISHARELGAEEISYANINILKNTNITIIKILTIVGLGFLLIKND